MATTMTALEENARFLTRKRLMRDHGFNTEQARKATRRAFQIWNHGWTPQTPEETLGFLLAERAIFTVSF